MKPWKLLLVALLMVSVGTTADSVPLPGGTLDPLTIPKYVTPLVIPPVMNDVKPRNRRQDKYEIAVRQFRQQILPGGIWKALNPAIPVDLPPTTVWSYGPAADPLPDAGGLGLPSGVAPAPNSQFNYPAYTFETKSSRPVDVKWINDLVDPATGECLPHLLTIDQTLHWANPPGGLAGRDMHGTDPNPYRGPVPIVTHVHGAHVDPHSDGYPEAWWLPACNNIPEGYATSGTFFDDRTGSNPGTLGYAEYSYRQDQPATTLWYHDHSLGMTRSNVYAGPAGFWLIRGGPNDQVDNVRTRWWKWDGVLPGPAPEAGDTVLELNAPGVLGAKDVRSGIREIPIVIQDRSFNEDGSLFYPDNRAFFEGLEPGQLQIPFAPDSDIAPIWNPEAFFNVMVVNGVSWPTLDVAPAMYRFRLLNGCNSRFLNLAMKIVRSPVASLVGQELSFYQIGAEQGFLPQVVEIRTGFATPLPGDGRIPNPANRVPAADPDQGLLMALAERADVIVDFRLLPPGTVIQMKNTGPDEPFGGFSRNPLFPNDEPVADPDTTGQVMQFVVKWNLFKVRDLFTTPPWALALNAESRLGDAGNVDIAGNGRRISLNEGESEQLCVEFDASGNLAPVEGSVPPDCANGGAPFAPKEALLGIVGDDGFSIPLKWTDTTGAGTSVPVTMADGVTVKMVNVTENPTLGATEQWDIYNFTVDAHPIHLHLVRFEVVNRQELETDTVEGAALQPAVLVPGTLRPPEPWESGYKDTVIAYPGEVTRVKARFDIEGLYVWHCHIVEHEDNEMMRPYVVSAAP